MLVYGQIQSNAMPAASWPTGAKVGGLALRVETGGGGPDRADIYHYERGRTQMQPLDRESIELITAIAPILDEICP